MAEKVVDLEAELRRALAARREPLAVIARAAGVFPSQLTRLVKGDRSVSLRTASKVLTYLGR